MNRTIVFALAAAAVLAGLTSPATAQRQTGHTGVGVSVHAHGRRHDVSFGIHFGGRRDHRAERRHVHHDSCRRWVPPHCETITERRWIPDRCERVWVPPVFRECEDGRGRRHRAILREGYWQTIRHPGRWENVTRTIQVPGRWETVCGR